MSELDSSTLHIPSPLPVAGVWQRQWEEDPLGDDAHADRTTLVLWTQTSQSRVYVDLRLPQNSPGRSLLAAQAAGIRPRPSALGFNDYSPDARRLLHDYRETIFVQKSFAGILNYKIGDTTAGDAMRLDPILAGLAANNTTSSSSSIPLHTCFWRRDLDYQPPSGGLDIGVCCSVPQESSRDDGSILLRETGDDGSYAEGWWRLPSTAQGPFMALALLAENGVTGVRSGYWVRAGDHFAYAVGRPVHQISTSNQQPGYISGSADIQACVGQSLRDAIQSVMESKAPSGEDNSEKTDTRIQQEWDLAASYVAIAGTVENPQGIYTILHSTNPELVGCALVGGDKFCCSQLTGEVRLGSEIDQTILSLDGSKCTRRWKVLEIDGCSLPA